MSEFGGLWKHENNQHILVPPKMECGCPSGGGIKNGHMCYPSYGGMQRKKEKEIWDCCCFSCHAFAFGKIRLLLFVCVFHLCLYLFVLFAWFFDPTTVVLYRLELALDVCVGNFRGHMCTYWWLKGENLMGCKCKCHSMHLCHSFPPSHSLVALIWPLRLIGH